MINYILDMGVRWARNTFVAIHVNDWEIQQADHLDIS